MEIDAREIKRLAGILDALSVDTRLRILKIISREEQSVQAIAEALKLTSSAVSSHLRILRSADLVIRNKKGHFVLYLLNHRRLAEYIRRINDFFNGSENQT